MYQFSQTYAIIFHQNFYLRVYSPKKWWGRKGSEHRNQRTERAGSINLDRLGRIHGHGDQAAESSTFKEALLSTGEKTLVYLDTDPWAGMMAPGSVVSNWTHIWTRFNRGGGNASCSFPPPKKHVKHLYALGGEGHVHQDK